MKEVIVQLLKQFYTDCNHAYMAGDFVQLRQLYEQVCLELEERMPVRREISLDAEASLKMHERIMVVANHIPTPNLFAINDAAYIKSLGIDPQDLHFNVIHPLPIRHYPLVNFFRMHHFNTHIVSREEPEPLASFYNGWENITIPEQGSNRISIINDLIETFKDKQWAVVVFPEGGDSHDDLYAGTYQLLPLKKGFAVLAQQHTLPVLPISLRFDPADFSYTMAVHPVITQTDDVSRLVTQAQECLTQ